MSDHKATCPTCGSDDPKVRKHRHTGGTPHEWELPHTPLQNHGRVCTWTCPNPVHDTPATDRHDLAVNALYTATALPRESLDYEQLRTIADSLEASFHHIEAERDALKGVTDRIQRENAALRAVAEAAIPISRLLHEGPISPNVWVALSLYMLHLDIALAHAREVGAL